MTPSKSDVPDLRPIAEIAAAAGIPSDLLEPFGRYKAKINLGIFDQVADRPQGKLILVTSINPTPAGEGKTVTAIGLAQGLTRLGERTAVTLREPSMGPTFGMKGGATGGGLASVHPADDINLHFTGDLHAVTAANNLLAAMIDNHIYRGNQLGIDVRKTAFPRAMDMNDRSLRETVIGLNHSVPRQASFQITAASEVMAILCLAEGYVDLKDRLGRIIVGLTRDSQPVRASDLEAEGAMAAILRDALKPNLIQTIEGTPVFVHGGPFANLAAGTNSIIATRLSRKLFDFTVIEAGFGSDLGAEKFVNIVSRYDGGAPDAAVVVVSLRALKHHGGAARDELKDSDPERVTAGLPNLERHLGIMAALGLPVVVAINMFPGDTDAEAQVVLDFCAGKGIPVARSEGFSRGGAGTVDLADSVRQMLAQANGQARPLYDLDLPLLDKINTVAKTVYGAKRVIVSPLAKRNLARAERQGFGSLPICMAKTQYSLSDNPKLLGGPTGFAVQVRDVSVRAGAGFVVVFMGDIMTMPGLPKRPNAMDMDLTHGGEISGVS